VQTKNQNDEKSGLTPFSPFFFIKAQRPSPSGYIETMNVNVGGSMSLTRDKYTGELVGFSLGVSWSPKALPIGVSISESRD
jgi:hypothetical protein